MGSDLQMQWHGLRSANATENARRRPLTKSLLALLAVALLSLPLMYFIMFTGIEHYDDEGTLLVGFVSLSNGRHMYDQIYSLYGPFYNLAYGFFYGPAGIPLTHTGGRTIALVMWVLFCSGFAFLAYRLTRSVAAMLLAYVAMVLVSRQLAHSPGHPEEISLVLAALVLICCSALDRKPSALTLATSGVAIACIGLIKINFGVYVGGAVALAMLSATNPGWWRRIAVPVVCCALLALPFAVESLLIAFGWVKCSIISSTLTIATVLLLVVARTTQTLLAERHWIIFVASMLLAGALILALTLLQGSSPYGILNSVLLQNVHFIQNWYIGSPIGRPGVYASGLSLLFCLLALYPTQGTQFAKPRSLFLGTAKILFGVLAILSVTDSPRIIIYLTPFCWLGLADADGETRPSIGRNALCLFAATMSLYPFPVAGHQVNIAAMPTLLVAILVLHDMGRALAARLASMWLRVAGGVVLAAVLGFYTIRGATDYARAQPLGLPGTSTIRVAADTLADIKWINGRLKSCGSSFSVPGQFSHGLWAGHPLITDLNVNHQLAFLSWPQQRQIISALSREPDVCILYNPALLKFFDRGQIATNPPLLRYIQTHTVEEAKRGDFVILRPRRS